MHPEYQQLVGEQAKEDIKRVFDYMNQDNNHTESAKHPDDDDNVLLTDRKETEEEKKEPKTHPAVEKAFQDMFKFNQPKDQQDNEDSMQNIENEDHFNFKVSNHTEGPEDVVKQVKKNILSNFGELFTKMK